VLTIALVVCAGVPDSFGDRLDLIVNATKVEAQRLTGEFDGDPHSKRRGVERFLTKGPFVELSKPLAERARKLVSSDKTYAEHGSRCEFVPGLLFRFTKGDDHADVLFCFHCGDAAVLKPEPEWPKEVWGFAAHFDYERARPGFVPGFEAMLKLARDVFPNDAELKKAKNPFKD
jgi:hypothetical protein